MSREFLAWCVQIRRRQTLYGWRFVVTMTSPGEAGGRSGSSHVPGSGQPASRLGAPAVAGFDTFAVGVTPDLGQVRTVDGCRGCRRRGRCRRVAGESVRVVVTGQGDGQSRRVGHACHSQLVCDRARRARRETLTGLSSGSEGTCSFEDRMVNRSELLASLRRLPRRQREAVALRYLPRGIQCRRCNSSSGL